MGDTMKMKKLPVKGAVCPVCNHSFNKNSRIAIISKSVITHFDHKCSMGYLIAEDIKRLETEREKMTRWDSLIYFTAEYEKSSKVVSEEEFKHYETMFKVVFILNNRISIMKIKRDRIWKAVGRKYIKELQYLHALAHIYEQNKHRWREGFKKNFTQSALAQFRAKGYLSKKQWGYVESLVDQNMKNEDRHRFYVKMSEANADDLMSVELPDRLRYMQRRKSFMEWFNKKNGIPEEE
jgi:hypothetical protein